MFNFSENNKHNKMATRVQEIHRSERDLARTGPVSLLKGIFLKNSFLDRQKFQWRSFNYDFLVVMTKSLPNNLSSRKWLKSKLPLLKQKSIEASWNKNLK